MSKSRDFSDLAARFNVRVEPVERDVPRSRPLSYKQRAALAARRQRELSQKHMQWERDGRYFEEVREGGARQAGTEPDRPPRTVEPADDPWREDRWARQWHKRDDPWGNE